MFLVLFYGVFLGYLASSHTENTLVIMGFGLAGMIVALLIKIWDELERKNRAESESDDNFPGPLSPT